MFGCLYGIFTIDIRFLMIMPLTISMVLFGRFVMEVYEFYFKTKKS